VDTSADSLVDSAQLDSAQLDSAQFDLSGPRRIHVVGVGGPGMSAIAIVLAQMGHQVSGSDIRERPVLDRLRAAGVEVHIGHSRSHVIGCDALTSSSAIPASNNECDEARRRGIPVLTRAGILAAICGAARSVAVAGTHGKTTTTSMVMLIMANAGREPSFVIGGDVTDTGTGAQWTGGEWLVVEADESDGTHLQLPLYATILTNIERDHLDHFGSFDALVESFDRYVAAIPGPRVVCGDDPVIRSLSSFPAAISYGLSEGCDYRAVDLTAHEGSWRFTIEHHGQKLVEVHLPLRGVHNVVNATGAAALTHAIGVEPEQIADALSRFGGVARRFDIRGTLNGATLVDDYAHLPGEIAAVLAAARHSGDGWKRVVAVFQPNRFHRIAEMWRDYAKCFSEADLVVLTDVYASGTMPIPGVTGKLIVNAVCEAEPASRVIWMPHREDLIRYLSHELRPGDVCISMGCGDIAALPDELLQRHAPSTIGAPSS
jgi:UDP-N-acetylmuramate--alanine ligase